MTKNSRLVKEEKLIANLCLPIEGYIYEEITYSFDELKSFLKNQDKKDLVIVTLDKNKNEIDYGLKDELRMLHKYFVSAGYKRIIISAGRALAMSIIVFLG